MGMNKLFIKTTDKDTAKKLQDQGLELVSQQGGVYCFLNNPSLSFSDNHHIVFSNTLSV